MEDRKQKEIDFYNRNAETLEKKFPNTVLSSYRFCHELLRKNCYGRVLDFGSGKGENSVFLSDLGAEVIGIDLSEKSLGIARKRNSKATFLKMDCEKLEFPNNHFDLVFDGETFSSIDIKKALPEIARVLKPSGKVIGIETFGHNLITNWKRQRNIKKGKRTEWAASHIIKEDDFKEAKKYFKKIRVWYFHAVSWAAFPFLDKKGGIFLLKFLEVIDRIILTNPFMKGCAFKVVFIFSEPK